MIPKIIHYCWFGGNPYPEKVQKCIDSWKRVLPDYELMLWNEDNFDVNMADFPREAYEKRQYAFVSDYARMYVLKKYGGVYFDVDIEAKRDIAPILENDLVIALDDSGDITGAFIAAIPEHDFICKLMDMYNSMKFIKEDSTYNNSVNNIWMQSLLSEYGYKKINKKQVLSNGIVAYPDDYFQAKSLVSGKYHITDNTYTIHHHTVLWVSKKTRIIKFIRMRMLVPIIGEKNYVSLVKKLKK